MYLAGVLLLIFLINAKIYKYFTWKLGYSHLRNLETMPQHSQRTTRSPPPGRINLWRILVGQISNLCVQNRRQRFEFVNKDKIAQWAGGEEKCVAFLQWHGRAELRFIVVISQVGNLIKIQD